MNRFTEHRTALLLAGSLVALGVVASLPGVHPRGAEQDAAPHPLLAEPPPFPLVETYLAANPSEPGHLLASAMGTSAERSIVLGSRDGGESWDWLRGPEGAVFPGGDPMLTFDEGGRAYFSTIAPEVHVWRSGDGGRSWEPPVVVGEAMAADRQWVATGPAGDGPFPPVYIASKTPGSNGRDVLLFSRSLDGGASFDEPTLMPLDSGYLHTVTDLVVRSDGAILLPFLANYGRRPGPEEVFRGARWILISRDGGRTWSRPRFVAANLQFGNRSWDRAMKGLGGGDLAVDEGDGPHHGSLYLTWPAILDGHLQIVAARSTDGGRSWSEPVRVNDGGFDLDHSTPSVAVDADGLVAVTWNDRRGDPEGLCYRHFVAFSDDGGRSFGPNRPVSDRRTCPGARSRWLNGGDTQGLAALEDGGFRTVWTVGSAGSAEGLQPWTVVVRPP